MQAYLNDPAIKARLIAQIQAHHDSDQIVKGIYWENGKGCAIGCSIHAQEHGKYETLLGIPQAVARLEDVIFEGLPNDAAKQWPLTFANAVAVGADLELVWPKFASWLLRGVLPPFACGNSQVLKVLGQAADIYDALIASNTFDRTVAYGVSRMARTASWRCKSAAESTARAVRSAAEALSSISSQTSDKSGRLVAWTLKSAAEAATRNESAMRAARTLVWAGSAADYCARTDFWSTAADKLIEIIQQAGADHASV